MKNVSRRALVAGSVGISLARPYIARATGVTAIVWQVQGFVPEEDAAFRKTVAEYQKLSGNTLDVSIMPFQALNQKAIAAIHSGEVPDLIFHDAPTTILPQNAWDDKLEDLSDVVEAQRSKLSATALLNASFYNSRTKKRAFYLAPVKQACAPFHMWGDLVRKAGFDLKDAPKTWDAYWDFFKPVQTALRKQGMRKLYALGLQITTVGPNDGNGLFAHFLIANGGQDIVTPDGKLHTGDPAIREAAIRAVEFMTKCYTDGFVPPEALSWNDADDNNAYHEKLFVMNFDGTLSPELAMIKNHKAYYEEMVVMGLPNRNNGSPMPAQLGAGGGFIPKGAKNIQVAKEFMTYFMRPEVMNENLKNGLGRWVPAIPSIVKEDPWWLDTATDPHRSTYVHEAVLGPTVAQYNGFNPAWGRVAAEQIWGQAHADVIKHGMTASAAIDKAFARVEEIFSKVVFG
jgi:multiple sugar transport system substrate-binding protein